jgi:hypothetical protein
MEEKLKVLRRDRERARLSYARKKRFSKAKKKFSRQPLFRWIFGVSAAIGTIAGLSGRQANKGQQPISKPVSRQVQPVRRAPVADPNKPVARPVAEPNKPVVKQGFPVASVRMSVLLPKGAKTLSAAQIDAELAKRGSPANGLGKIFVKCGKHYGIRPAVALAFFRKESTWGTKGLATKNKAIGNIRFTPTSGSGVKYTNYKGFRKYEAWEHGIQDWFWLISSKNYAGGGKVSLEKIISKYSPASDMNDPAGYQRLVVSYLNELYKNASK